MSETGKKRHTVDLIDQKPLIPFRGYANTEGNYAFK